MKIIYFLKNLKTNKIVIDFIKAKVEKLSKILKKNPNVEEGLVEVELAQDKETKFKKGLYKAKVILDLPQQGLVVFQSFGKNIFSAINSAFKKLFSNLSKRKRE